MSTAGDEELFGEDLLAAAGGFSVDLRRVQAGPRSGLHNSRAAGLSLDFRDFRPYTPGDDLRRIDWNVFQRTGQMFIRRFEHPTAATVSVLVDNSESMFLESPSRYAAGARVAAVVVVAAAGGQDPVSVSVFGPGSASAGPVRRVTGRTGIHAALSHLRGAKAAECSLRRAVDEFAASRPGKGVAVVVSDFLDPSGARETTEHLERLLAAAGRLVMVQITQPWDFPSASYPLGGVAGDVGGEIELVDCESGETAMVTLTPEVIGAYQAARDEHQRALRRFADQRGVPLVEVDASAAIVPQLSKLFPGGVLRTGGAMAAGAVEGVSR